MDFLADPPLAAVDDNHGAVVEVADALARLVAGFENFDGHGLSGQDDGLHGVGQVVDVYDVHPPEAGHFIEIVIVGDHFAAEFLGRGDQLVVHRFGLFGGGQGNILDFNINLLVALHFVKDIEAAAAAIAFEAVGGIGDILQFIENEAGNDYRGIDDFGHGDIGNPAVNDDRGVQKERTDALDLFGKFDIGDDEAEIVLGLHDEDNGQITAEDIEGELDAFLGHAHNRVGMYLIDIVNIFQQIIKGQSAEQAYHQAEKNACQGGQIFFGQEDINGQSQQQDDAADD
ncbi:MAG: hypothetical protein BWY71_02165 [Planctomycetes bacterium ADurb.Bin412]|nr:MAG: hypothetical protein BWY71_02165 [Planctomycetes bacterium ADurb.Bin412]